MHQEHKVTFFIHRNKNKQIIRNIMNTINWEENNEAKDLSKSDSLSSQQLQAMHLVAKMRDAANMAGAGFVGGFISPTGEKFMMSNMDEDDPQYTAIQAQLNRMQEQRMSAQQNMAQHQRNINDIISDFEGMIGRLRDEEEGGVEP